MEIRIEMATEIDAAIIAGYIKDMLLYTEKLGSHKPNRSPKKWKEFTAYIKKAINSDPKHIFFIAKIENRIVGFSEAAIQELPIVLEPKVLLHISAVYVEDEFRKNGIGKKLVQRLIQWGKRHSATEINLNVLAKNPAINLYKSMGFQEARIEMVNRL
jgi:GNAT superfamily N-acetyltransferase